jgi:hypothetical protein
MSICAYDIFLSMFVLCFKGCALTLDIANLARGVIRSPGNEGDKESKKAEKAEKKLKKKLEKEKKKELKKSGKKEAKE